MRKCLKCGHVSSAIPDPQACPSCGAVYAKVESAQQANTAAAAREAREAQRRRDSQFAKPSGFSSAKPQSAQATPFLKRLRAESAYPTFRALVGLFTWLLVIIAGIAVLVAWISGSAAAAIGTTAGSLVVIIFALAGREVALMLADLSDASIRTAERQERGDSPDTR